MIDPYAAPNVKVELDTNISQEYYGGIGRLIYVFTLLALIAVLQVGKLMGIYTLTIGGAYWVFILGALIATFYRFKNIGMAPELAFLVLMPFMNLFIFARGLICQEGYFVTNKLDRVGTMIIFLILGLIGLFVLFIAVAAVFLPH